MAVTQYYGTGRRKTSTARVFLTPGTGNITIRRLNKPQQNIFHVFTDITGLGQLGCVGDTKRYVENACQGLR